MLPYINPLLPLTFNLAPDPCLHCAVAPPSTKRLPKGPRGAFSLENVKMETITAIPYDIVKEGLQ
jgi:hypothetical protein